MPTIRHAGNRTTKARPKQPQDPRQEATLQGVHCSHPECWHSARNSGSSSRQPSASRALIMSPGTGGTDFYAIPDDRNLPSNSGTRRSPLTLESCRLGAHYPCVSRARTKQKLSIRVPDILARLRERISNFCSLQNHLAARAGGACCPGERVAASSGGGEVCRRRSRTVDRAPGSDRLSNRQRCSQEQSGGALGAEQRSAVARRAQPEADRGRRAGTASPAGPG